MLDLMKMLDTSSESFVFRFLIENNITFLEYDGRVLVTQLAFDKATESKLLNQDMNLMTYKEVQDATRVKTRKQIIQLREKGEFPHPINPTASKNKLWKKSDIIAYNNGKRTW
ncbi:hypothetical protein GCM10023116_29680 [Kistimonas scapharcae]|uniref:DNA-binding protein n=2 Tax=Kistimonas scapharcae TaxID=1036133 RepID=A0ABP8V3L2_9GAMM